MVWKLKKPNIEFITPHKPLLEIAPPVPAGQMLPDWFSAMSNDIPERPLSDTWRFYLQGDGETNSAPFMAQLISPNSGESLQLTDGALNFVWSGQDPDGDSILFTLFVDTIDGLQTPPESQVDISSSNLSVDLEPNTVYYWSVFSRDINNNTSHSQVYSFRVLE